MRPGEALPVYCWWTSGVGAPETGGFVLFRVSGREEDIYIE